MSKKASVPFGKRTITFPYQPNHLAEQLYDLLQEQGKTTTVDKAEFKWTDSSQQLTVSSFFFSQDNRRVVLSVMYQGRQKLMLSFNLDTDHITVHSAQVKLYVPGDWEEFLRKLP